MKLSAFIVCTMPTIACLCGVVYGGAMLGSEATMVSGEFGVAEFVVPYHEREEIVRWGDRDDSRPHRDPPRLGTDEVGLVPGECGHEDHVVLDVVATGAEQPRDRVLHADRRVGYRGRIREVGDVAVFARDRGREQGAQRSPPPGRARAPDAAAGRGGPRRGRRADWSLVCGVSYQSPRSMPRKKLRAGGYGVTSPPRWTCVLPTKLTSGSSPG